MIGSTRFITYVFSAYFNRSLIWVNIGQCHHCTSKDKKKIIHPLHTPTLNDPRWKAEEECLTCHPSCSLLLVNIQMISSREPLVCYRKQRCKAPLVCSTPLQKVWRSHRGLDFCFMKKFWQLFSWHSWYRCSSRVVSMDACKAGVRMAMRWMGPARWIWQELLQ